MHRFLLAIAAVVALAPARAGPTQAAEWPTVFAGESDTVLVLADDGGLWKAPFSLATRRILWAPRGRERLTRVQSNPSGTQVAWLTRGAPGDTTRLWFYAHDPPGGAARPAASYLALQPWHWGLTRFETDLPTVADVGRAGERLIEPSMVTQRFASNTLAWNGDGHSVLVGHDEGLIEVHVASDSSADVTPLRIAGLRRLAPSSVMLLEGLVPDPVVSREGVRVHDTRWLFAYPTAGGWKFFDAGSFDRFDTWSADFGTIWWIEGRTIRSVRLHDPTPVVDVRANDPIVWLHVEGARLSWVAGRGLWSRPVDGPDATARLSTGTPVRAVIETPGSPWKGLVTADSLVWWNTRDETVRATALEGRSPVRLLAVEGGGLFVAMDDRNAPLARVHPETGRLDRVASPAVRRPAVVPSPSGRHLLVFERQRGAPRTFHVYDVRERRWDEVANPGLIGWEPIRP